jgi:peptidoglycan/LPS O-acetylase OafA/YrhL
MLREKVYFPDLDGLRFIAATMVFLQHAFARWAETVHVENDFIVRFFRTFASGGFGVSIFFVLSGFLISYLLLTEKKLTGKILLRNFYIRRVLRIWPLYFAVVFFGFILYPGIKGLMGIETHLASRQAYYWTFLSNFDEIYLHHFCPGCMAQIQSITWSVSIEEQFYLVWPVLFIVIPSSKYLYIFITLILFSIGFRIYNAGDDPVLYFHTFSVVLDLATGGLAAWLVLNSERFVNFFRSMSMPATSSIYIAGFLMLMYWDKCAGLYHDALVRILFAIYFAFIIVHQVYGQHSFLKLSNFKFMTSMGKYTYGMYLLHPVALLSIDILMRVTHFRRDTFSTELLFAVSTFLLTIAISYASYHLYEKHFLKLKKRFSVIVHENERGVLQA